MGWRFLGLVARQLSQGIPDEANELTGDGNQDFITVESPGGQFVKPAVETVLGLPASFQNRVGLAFLATGEFLADFRGIGVVLRTLTRSLPLVSPFGLPAAVSPAASQPPVVNKQPTGVRVTAFGNGALPAFVTAGCLRRHQSEVAHELAGVVEAGKGAKLGDRDHGCNDPEAFKRHQGIDGRLESP